MKIALFLVTLIISLTSIAQETIHVMVALCDNKYQGIVKVPAGIGNGQDPKNNLYWGYAYGVRTYFRKSEDWEEIKHYKVDKIRLERSVFKHKTKNYYLIADAYDGKYIKDCTKDFLMACSGIGKDTINVNGVVLGLKGNSKLIAYIGHDGLMDFSLSNIYKNSDGKKRDAIILACYSKKYFTPYLKTANANPLLWTTHKMCPEAYTLHDAIATYINGGSAESVHESAAAAYNKYQKCGINGAKRLLVTGF